MTRSACGVAFDVLQAPARENMTMSTRKADTILPSGLTDSRAWQAVEERDARFDGHLICAVITTGIYCRPSCHSRQPLRRNVRFFASAVQAQQAGFRACKRCHPDAVVSQQSQPW